jgi:hypothetical protein
MKNDRLLINKNIDILNKNKKELIDYVLKTFYGDNAFLLLERLF